MLHQDLYNEMRGNQASSPSLGSPFLKPSQPRMQGMRMARAMRMAPMVLRNIASWLKFMYFPPRSVMTSPPMLSRPVSLKEIRLVKAFFDFPRC